MLQDRRWLCVQLGAREHYALPRALASIGVLEALVTDLWMPPGVLSRFNTRLAERFDSTLGEQKVFSNSLSSLVFEAYVRGRSAIGRDSGWERILCRNAHFDRAARRHVRNILANRAVDAPDLGVFAFSYAATSTLREVSDRGFKTVLGQIDGGPIEEEIVLQEKAKYPELHDQYVPAPPKYWSDWRDQCSASAQIVVNSPWARSCIERSGIPAEKLVTVPLFFEGPAAVSLPRVLPPPSFSRERPLRVLFLGQFNLRKGAARLFEAMRLLQGEAIDFWIVGPSQVEVPDDVRKLPGAHFLGPVNRSKVEHFYREADVFILPTLSDGFAITLLEAQYFRLPIIASRSCGEVVRDGLNGLVLPEVSGTAIAECILALGRDPERLGAMSRAAVNTFAGPQEYARRFLEVTCA